MMSIVYDYHSYLFIPTAFNIYSKMEWIETKLFSSFSIAKLAGMYIYYH